MSSDLRAILLASVAGAVAGAAVVFYLSPQKSGKATGVRTIILQKECRSSSSLRYSFPTNPLL